MCREFDPRVGILFTAAREIRGRPMCRRPAGHTRAHKGDGWIWTETQSRYTTRTIRRLTERKHP